MIGKGNKFVFSAAIGNALEWYDFTIYAFFVPIIARQFFPNKSVFLSLIATLGVFALGFLVRPLGAILFGYIGDHSGRKKALILSMIMMSCPTFVMGLLPSYNAIGVLAPLCLMALRIIQGLAVSGELTTATIFLIEHADKDKRGIAGSLAMAGALLGMVLSSICATLMGEFLSASALEAWGWRVPFLIGGLLGVIGLVVRLRTSESSLFLKTQAQKQATKPPGVLHHISSLNRYLIVTGIGLTSIMAVANYFLIGYFNTFLVENQGFTLRSAMIINTFALSLQLVVTVLMGRVSDAVGRKVVLKSGIVSLIAFSYPIFWLLTQHDFYLALLAEMLFALVAGSLTGVVPTALAELFDTYHRNMGISISYNSALALFGGTAPLVAVSLVASTHNVYAPAWYIIIVASLAFITLKFMKESYQKQIAN